MTVMGWVAIGVCVAQMLFTVISSVLRRPGQRLAELERAVFGESGVNVKLTRYVTTEAFERRMEAIDQHLKAVGEEGEAREDRILMAITNQGVALSQSLSELRTDLREQAKRIDDVMARNGGGR